MACVSDSDLQANPFISLAHLIAIDFDRRIVAIKISATLLIANITIGCNTVSYPFAKKFDAGG